MSRTVAATAVVVLMVGFVQSADKLPDPRPVGTWDLNAGGVRSALNIKEGRLHWRLGNNAGQQVQIDADYSVTKDNLVYAVITKIEGTIGTEKLPGEDDTFSFRFRVDDDELNVKNVKGKGFDDSPLAKLAQGRYKLVKGPPKKEEPKKD